MFLTPSLLFGLKDPGGASMTGHLEPGPPQILVRCRDGRRAKQVGGCPRYDWLAPATLAQLLKMLFSEQRLSEREQQLRDKSSELLALQKEMDSMRADFSLLRNQFLTERKKAETQVASLKEALKIQRSQLEKNLLVSPFCPVCCEQRSCLSANLCFCQPVPNPIVSQRMCSICF